MVSSQNGGANRSATDAVRLAVGELHLDDAVPLDRRGGEADDSGRLGHAAEGVDAVLGEQLGVAVLVGVGVDGGEDVGRVEEDAVDDGAGAHGAEEAGHATSLCASRTVVTSRRP